MATSVSKGYRSNISLIKSRLLPSTQNILDNAHNQADFSFLTAVWLAENTRWHTTDAVYNKKLQNNTFTVSTATLLIKRVKIAKKSYVSYDAETP